MPMFSWLPPSGRSSPLSISPKSHVSCAGTGLWTRATCLIRRRFEPWDSSIGVWEGPEPEGSGPFSVFLPPYSVRTPKPSRITNHGSTEQILTRRPNQVPASPVTPGPAVPTNQGSRYPLRLAHDEIGGGGQLVGYCDLGDFELMARPVPRPSQVEDRLESGDADRDVCQSLAPRSAERVRDDDR